MKCIVDDDVVLSRPLEGPLSAHIVGFAKWASDEGYASATRWRKVFLAAGFSRWLGQQAVRIHRISSEHAARYLRYHAGRVQIHRGDGAALSQFIGLLRRQGVVPRRRSHPAGRRPRRSKLRTRSRTTCATSARWRKQPSSTTYPSSAGSSPIGSAIDRYDCQACVLTMSCDLSSAKRRSCI